MYSPLNVTAATRSSPKLGLAGARSVLRKDMVQLSVPTKVVEEGRSMAERMPILATFLETCSNIPGFRLEGRNLKSPRLSLAHMRK